ncbi:MAG: hypothetical protein RML93_08085, partial [Anaerolineales bacterium]|nr:hypothetical protein [Anaerolineales bacterium]MDW8447234.1 hypothetical protein [Anaerolineales bacterium]
MKNYTIIAMDFTGFISSILGVFMMDIPDGILGGNPLRADSVEKVTGRAKYAEDIHQEGIWTILVGRSPYFHARLLKLDARQAESAPGVRKVLTWKDIPGVNGFEEYSREEPVLPRIGETLRMKGAPIFLLVAETLEQGLQALPLV